MKAKWKPIAINGRRRIAAYILDRFGENSKADFMAEIRETVELLKNNPYMFAIDPLFADRARTYRSAIINRKSKMVYYVEDNVIQIAGFWDCRQDPIAQAKQVE
jgi:plasmid stabilization system protein ParE